MPPISVGARRAPSIGAAPPTAASSRGGPVGTKLVLTNGGTVLVLLTGRHVGLVAGGESSVLGVQLRRAVVTTTSARSPTSPLAAGFMLVSRLLLTFEC